MSGMDVPLDIFIRSEGGRPLRNLHCPSTSFDVSNQNPIERIFPLDTHIALEGNSNERVRCPQLRYHFLC